MITAASNLSTLEREFYPVKEAARLLQTPESTLRWWLEGRHGRGKQYPPVIREESTGSGFVTWGEFVEARYLRAYRRKDVPLKELRQFIDDLRQELGIRYPLAHFHPFVSGARRKLVLKLQEKAGLAPEFGIALEVNTGQMLLSSTAEAFLEEVEFSREGDLSAVRMFPAGKKSPVVIDPTRAFGAPSIRGIRTEVLTELIDAGEPPADIAKDFGLPMRLVKAAAAYEWSLTA